jgi:hypothetical protein
VKTSLRFLIVLFLLSGYSYSQQFDIRKYSYYLPGTLEYGQLSHLLGLSAIKMPEDIIEDETFLRSPLLFYKLKLGLPYNFKFLASVESNIITFHFEGGLGWHFLLDKFSFAPEIRSSYWTGRLKLHGFDSRMTGVDVTPGFSAGYTFRKFSITLKAELLYQISNTIRAGEITVSRDPQKFNGYSAGIFVEQPLWGNHVLVIGFRSIHVQLYYPIWVAFSTFERKFHVTEASMGLIL